MQETSSKVYTDFFVRLEFREYWLKIGGYNLRAKLRAYYQDEEGHVLFHDNYTVFAGNVFTTSGSTVDIHLVRVTYEGGGKDVKVEEIEFIYPETLKKLEEATHRFIKISHVLKNKGIIVKDLNEAVEKTFLEIEVFGDNVDPSRIIIPLRVIYQGRDREGREKLAITEKELRNIDKDFDREIRWDMLDP